MRRRRRPRRLWTACASIGVPKRALLVVRGDMARHAPRTSELSHDFRFVTPPPSCFDADHHESAAPGSCQLWVALLVAPCCGQDCTLRLTVARQRTAQRDVDGQLCTREARETKTSMRRVAGTPTFMSRRNALNRTRAPASRKTPSKLVRLERLSSSPCLFSCTPLCGGRECPQAHRNLHKPPQ